MIQILVIVNVRLFSALPSTAFPDADRIMKSTEGKHTLSDRNPDPCGA